MPGQNKYDYAPEYVAARSVLLDALDALREHLPSIIVVGAQAVYLHTGSGDFVDAPMTTDGDLALNVASLATEPEITAAMRRAEFTEGANPGSWKGRGEVAVDIMVVPSQSGRTGLRARAAHLEGHEKWAARITPGLEAALVDHTNRALVALDPADVRQIGVNIAGPAALLVAKAVKFEERLADTRAAGTRVKGKDALDMLRLLRAVDTEDLIAGLRRHRSDERAQGVSARAMNFLNEHGTTPTSVLALAAEAVVGYDPTIAPSFAELARALTASYYALE